MNVVFSKSEREVTATSERVRAQMSAMRSRSNSVGRMTDGVNLYQTRVASARQETMNDEGRAEFHARLANAVGCTVEFMRTVARGNREYDEFRIAREHVSGRNHAELLAAIGKLSAHVSNTNGHWFVYWPRARYEKRVPGLDFTSLQCATMMLLAALVVILLVLAYDHHNYSIGKTPTPLLFDLFNHASSDGLVVD